MGFNVSKGDIATEQAEGFAVDAFDRVTRSYKPEDGSFTNWMRLNIAFSLMIETYISYTV